MALRIIPLSLSDLFNSLPTDQKLKPQAHGIAFTGAVSGVTGAPAYLDPSHVATWHLGYLAAQAERAGDDNSEKED